MARRIALLLALVATLAAAPVRGILETPDAPAPCAPSGRGRFPRHWVGCETDPGPVRPLASDERLALGLRVDPNRASARELAFVPGLSRRLGAEVVADRERNGPFPDVESLLRVRGVGPKRLAQAREALVVEP
ncbi:MULTISPECIES: helix-hairpin-helix domain-containing protein [Anaeromyxobacter]|uniref:helix-hairpin-helix domain-containing protein n=1 Tax=Anaeromyxobacter TaxID=161492 RepID=UPI001F586937|nr:MULTISPECIES: helix-hairpin-helix domain-containing protein [unclassified Anaeromyxobacter]